MGKHTTKRGLRVVYLQEYAAWQNMKLRCSNPNITHYQRYGGRGIKVCDRWINSFEHFLNDMGKRPDGLTLERIDNNGNYEPRNCKWATQKEQANNKSYPCCKQDEFTPLPVSGQRKSQLRRVKLGKCVSCNEKIYRKDFCKIHYDEVQIYQRAYREAKRKAHL